MVPGRKGKVAYIYAPELNHLQKLMAMGILPGASMSLIQSFPSYVFKVGQAQFAVDKEIADAIYVRLVEPETVSEMDEGQSLRHKRRRGLRQTFGRWWSKGS
jgi:Fe2+ transport system protein FeoA